MQRFSALNPSETKILEALKEYGFLVHRQLMAFTGYASSTIADTLKRLVLMGLVEKMDLLSPAVYRLSSKGAQIVSTNYRKTRSYPAIQHIVHVAESIRMLRMEFPEARLIKRQELYAQGLYPSVGEHAAEVGNVRIFLLVDDYLMRPGRAGESWIRKHTPVSRFVDIVAIRNRGEFLVTRWCDMADHYRIYTTDERQLDRLETAVKQAGITATVKLFKPVWRYS